MKKTLFISGPSGIGKSPIDFAIKNDITGINPYRLREHPRNSEDYFYGNWLLKEDFLNILSIHNEKFDREISNEELEWYPKSKTLFFNARGTWQILPLYKNFKQEGLFKTEIYAPALPALLQKNSFTNIFGEIFFLLLNPASKSILEMEGNYDELKLLTTINLIHAGEKKEKILGRINSLDKEISAWQTILKILDKGSVLEIKNWKYSEGTYLDTCLNEKKLIQFQKDNLVSAKDTILKASKNELKDFFKDSEQIQDLDEVIVNSRS